MQLKKRDCKISVKLEPVGVSTLSVEFDLYGEKLSFGPSSVMGAQFKEFISALYALYFEEPESENYDYHNDHYPCESSCFPDSNIIDELTSEVNWDEEGSDVSFKISRKINDNNENDIITLKLSTDFGESYREFKVNGKDFCYAVAKGCTEVLKEFGFYGYRFSTEGDYFIMHQLLFIKAYALDNMEARELIQVTPWLGACKSSFEKELELLLFDM